MMMGMPMIPATALPLASHVGSGLIAARQDGHW